MDVTCSTKRKACSAIAYTYTRSCSDVWMRNQKNFFGAPCTATVICGLTEEPGAYQKSLVYLHDA